MFERNASRLIRRYAGETLWIEPWGENAFRIRASYLESTPEENWALLAPAYAEAEICIEGRRASLKNGKIRVEVSEGGSLSFYRSDGTKILEEYWRTRDPGYSEQSSL